MFKAVKREGKENPQRLKRHSTSIGKRNIDLSIQARKSATAGHEQQTRTFSLTKDLEIGSF